ncbi:MAG: lipocalin family protein [Bauldia sp.]|nr:lipocalin family protein [Bauldia sp.]
MPWRRSGRYAFQTDLRLRGARTSLEQPRGRRPWPSLPTDYLWILSRTPTLDAATLARLIDTAAAAGFPVEDLIMVDQSAACTPRQRVIR